MTTNAQRLALYQSAEEKILLGQSVSFAGRQLQLPDLAMVQKEIARLQTAVARETAAARGRGGRFSQADFGGRS